MYQEQWLFSAPADTGERRRRSDAAPLLAELLDEATVQGIADEAWLALVGEAEVLVPLPGEPVTDPISSWVEIVGPWNGAVVLTCDRTTAEELARCLLREHAPDVLDPEDVDDALGELANVIGGNVKAVLPGPSVLGLPAVGAAPAPGGPTDTCRIDVLWRGRPLTVSVQGPAGA
ncbi:chemotaxis protein CheX [Geodermatophilus sp. YIM 151500]|uniref:chemotaxis protein CheX n=1 Tax=Geodermatophilus sp. YIM 151500 TaxID=2984531 RepID=UPI0021E49699|nr:chemotaxis protein CheX [Geodermatophilus sp. YIM 151500]MCV2490024.1 chemotaxis protein CheX [Geodermatophilus sp. YIM 151500]